MGIEAATKNYEYDMLGRLISSTDGKGKKARYTYCGTDWVSEISTPFESGRSALTKYKYDKSGNQISSYYYVNTSSQTYFILLRDYPIDEKNSNNKGLYTLLIVRKENEEDIWDKNKGIIYEGNKKLDHPGIYIPIK